jgi:hypothetical protein
MVVNDIINNSKAFYNVNYREYYGIIDNYIITVYPFVTQIFLIQGPKFDRYNYDTCDAPNVTIARHHHRDFIDKKCDIDPCMTYEDVSGVRIHTEHEEDNIHISNEIYELNKLDFFRHLGRQVRRLKIKNINENRG